MKNKQIKLISHNLFKHMKKNAISLSVLDSAHAAIKVLSPDDFFDFIAYNDRAIVTRFLNNNQTKLLDNIALPAAFDFMASFDYDYVNSTLSKAYVQKYPGMDILNLYRDMSPSHTQRHKSLFKALNVLRGMNTTWPAPTLGGDIPMNTSGLPESTKKFNCSDFFEIVQTEETVFIVIKDRLFWINQVLTDKEVFYIKDLRLTWPGHFSIKDIEPHEPDEIEKLLFQRAFDKATHHLQAQDWNTTMFGKLYTRVFVTA